MSGETVDALSNLDLSKGYFNNTIRCHDSGMFNGARLGVSTSSSNGTSYSCSDIESFINANR